MTLANILEKLSINYKILEGHLTITPQVGASIGMLPNGLLDQIGLADDIRALIKDALQVLRLRAPGGQVLPGYEYVAEQVKAGLVLPFQHQMRPTMHLTSKPT